MNVTLIGGGVIDSDNIIFHVDALNNGTLPVFVAADTGQSLDNLLKVADMDNLFAGDGWNYNAWNAWRAAHPYVATTYTPFQNQQNVPDTTVLGALADQNILATAGNYYLDAATNAVKNNPGLAIGALLIVVVLIIVAVKEVRD